MQQYNIFYQYNFLQCRKTANYQCRNGLYTLVARGAVNRRGRVTKKEVYGRTKRNIKKNVTQTVRAAAAAARATAGQLISAAATTKRRRSWTDDGSAGLDRASRSDLERRLALLLATRWPRSIFLFDRPSGLRPTDRLERAAVLSFSARTRPRPGTTA